MKDCPMCGAKESVEENIITDEYTLQSGVKVSIPNVTIFHCNTCNEDLLDNTSRKRVERIIKNILIAEATYEKFK